MSLGSNEALKHAVGAGLGLAVDSGPAAHRDTPWVPVPVEGFPIRRQWSVVWRAEAPLDLSAQRFVDYLQTGAPVTGQTG